MSKLWKKSAASIIVAAAVMSSLSATALANEKGITVKVNGKVVTSSVNTIMNGKTYVDLAAFAEAAGISYTYDAKAKTATINGKAVAIATIGGKPAAYVRALAVAAGFAGIVWDASSQTALFQSKQNLVVYGDVVSEQLGCVLSSRFAVGDKIIFRMKAVNPATGNIVEDAKLQVKLGTGEVLDMQLAEHPPGVPGAEKFWTAAYNVTDKTPRGLLKYSITAENATMKGTFEPFNVMPSLITIVDAAAAAPAEAPPEK